MDAGFEELAHGELRQSHNENDLSFPVEPPRETVAEATPERSAFLSRPAHPRVWVVEAD